MYLLSTTLIVLVSGLYVFRLHKAHPYMQGSWRLHSSQSCSFLRRRIRYCPSSWDQEMVTKSLTTSIAGLVVACFSVHLSMVPSGFGITSGTISLSSANKRKPPALPRLRFSVSSCFPHFDPFGSTSVRSSFISSTCHFVRVLEMCSDHGLASVLTYVSFFITICYHTPFAQPWIYPALAFYGLDLLMRVYRFRIKDASLTPMTDMTMVLVPGFFSRPQLFADGVFVDSHTRL